MISVISNFLEVRLADIGEVSVTCAMEYWKMAVAHFQNLFLSAKIRVTFA